MDKIIKIGWSTKFLVPGRRVAAFVEMLGNIQLIEGSESLPTLKYVEFEVSNPHPDLGREVTQRERELEKKSEENSTRWYAEYNNANKLEKELAALKAQNELLIEQGIKGAFCHQVNPGVVDGDSDEL